MAKARGDAGIMGEEPPNPGQGGPLFGGGRGGHTGAAKKGKEQIKHSAPTGKRGEGRDRKTIV